MNKLSFKIKNYTFKQKVTLECIILFLLTFFTRFIFLKETSLTNDEAFSLFHALAHFQ